MLIKINNIDINYEQMGDKNKDTILKMYKVEWNSQEKGNGFERHIRRTCDYFGYLWFLDVKLTWKIARTMLLYIVFRQCNKLLLGRQQWTNSEFTQSS